MRAVLLGVGGLTLWALLPGLAMDRVVQTLGGPNPKGAEWRLGFIVLWGSCIAVLGSEALAHFDALSRHNAWLVGLILGVTSAATFLVLGRMGRHVDWGWKSPLGVWTAIVAVVVVIVAILPQLLVIVRRPDSLVGSTPWYYWHLAQQVAANGGRPPTTFEWGTAVPTLGDYPGFMGVSALAALLTGRTDLLFGAQLIRVAALFSAGLGLWLLVRSWGSGRIAAAGSVGLAFALEVFAVKLSSFRPEAAAYGLMFLVLAFGRQYLETGAPATLVAAAVGFAAISQIHGLVWVFTGLFLGAMALAHFLWASSHRRTVLLHAFLLVALSAAFWIATDIGFRGQVSDAAKLETLPVLGPNGEDPTWAFATIGTRAESSPPPILSSQLLSSLDRGLLGRSALGVGVIAAGALLVLGWVAIHGDRRSRILLTTLVAFGIAVAGVIAVFAFGWHTYVPRRTGAQRIFQLSVILVPLAAAVATSRLGPGKLSKALSGIWLLVAMLFWALSIPQIVRIARIQQPPHGVLAYERGLDLSGQLVLANAYTEGYLPVVFHADGLLDGRAPYTQAHLLERANTLLTKAEKYFAQPATSDLDPAALGVDYVLVTTKNWLLGTPRIFPADINALEASPDLTLVDESQDLYVFRVNH